MITACKGHFGKDTDNFRVEIDRETYDFHVYVDKIVVEQVENDVTEISLADAKLKNSKYELGDTVSEEVKSKEFGRITTQNARNVILQKIREEERNVLFDQYYAKEKDVVTGVVQRYIGKNVSVNLGKVDAILNENEMVKGEVYTPTERIKVYILEVSSPGLGRPLKKDKDLERSLGESVDVRLFRAIDRQKEFTGILKAWDKETVTLEFEDEAELVIERANIALIRLAFDF